MRRESCAYFSWLLSQYNAALTEQIEPVQSHGGSSAFYSTYVPALALFVFGRLMCCILLSLSEKGFCTCKSQELNYRALSRYGTSDKIYSIYSCCLRCCFFFFLVSQLQFPPLQLQSGCLHRLIWECQCNSVYKCKTVMGPVFPTLAKMTFI